MATEVLKAQSTPNVNGLEVIAGTVAEKKTKLVKKLFAVPNERGGTTWAEKCPDYITSVSWSPDHAIVARYKEARSGTSRNSLSLCSIVIQSPYLKQLVRQIFKSYPGEAVDKDEPTFEAPFYPFFHQWATLSSVYENAEQGVNEDWEHIAALLDILGVEFEDTLKDARNLTKMRNITFRLLWTLFPPACPVLGQWKNKEHCFLVNDAKYHMAEIEPTFALELLFLDHDGEKYGWRKISKFIGPFSGSMKIAVLPVVPLQFHEASSSVLETLSTRGNLAVDLMKGIPLYKAYQGSIRLHRFDMDEQEIFVEGRILIDAKSHSQQVSRYSPTVFTIPHRLESLLSRDSDTKLVVLDQNDENESGLLKIVQNLNEHPVLGQGHVKLEPATRSDGNDQSPLKRHRWTEGLLGIRPETFCRSVVRGYCLTSKCWAQFEAEKVTSIQWNKNAFDALVMPPARKRLVEALIKQQQNHKADADVDDVVQGKGQGLIMLLTGPPGTGKTLTAESVADRLQLPLYALNAGELGDTAKEIETHFGQVLRLAAFWNAVLLLDEADAFLERRVDSPEARERNKRVAAFLRILEYYKGILILTTNRIVNFDDAFYSRIHLTLPFRKLDQRSRENIWMNFVRGADISTSDLTVFASEDLNGRQIKNIMKMSRLLAKNTGQTLCAGHIRDVLEVVKEDFDPVQD